LKSADNGLEAINKRKNGLSYQLKKMKSDRMRIMKVLSSENDLTEYYEITFITPIMSVCIIENIDGKNLGCVALIRP